MRKTKRCDTLSPHRTLCGLREGHDGAHHDRFAECVWEEDGYHMHDGRLVSESANA